MSKVITTWNAKTLSAKDVKAFLVTEGSQRDRLQGMIEACLGHCQLHNAPDLLNTLVNGLKEIKSRNLKAVTAYINQHFTGYKWQILGDKTYGYKRVKEVEVTFDMDFSVKWYDHKLNKQDVDFNFDNRLASFIGSIKTALESGTFKGDKAKAEALVASFGA